MKVPGTIPTGVIDFQPERALYNTPAPAASNASRLHTKTSIGRTLKSDETNIPIGLQPNVTWTATGLLISYH